MREDRKFKPSDISAKDVMKFKKELRVMKAIDQDKLSELISNEINSKSNEDVVSTIKGLIRSRIVSTTNETLDPLDLLSGRTFLQLNDFGKGLAQNVDLNNEKRIRHVLSLIYTIGDATLNYLFQKDNM